MCRRPFLFLLIFSLIGCAGLTGQQRIQQFYLIAKTYKRALTMSDFRTASNFIRGSKENLTTDFNQYANIKIVRYKITRLHVAKDQRSIEQDVELQYYLLNQNRLKTKIDHQVWQYVDQHKVWLLQTGLPDF